jgi:hypothetical protein
MSEAHLALLLVVALVALLLLAAHRRVGAHDTRAPSLSVRARRRNSEGAELAVDVAARGWPAIVTVAVLAAIAAACVFIR